MIIAIINNSDGALRDGDLQAGIRAVNRQMQYDFLPYWGFSAQLRLEGKRGRDEKFDPADVRGDAVLYVLPLKGDDDDGFHTANLNGIPYGFVYLDLAKKLDEDWSVTLSHEALELVGDPELNMLVKGPHPEEERDVYHWFEMCDAVQDESYPIDGIKVSNFVLPLYFTSSDERGGRNDFLGTIHRGKTLESVQSQPRRIYQLFRSGIGRGQGLGAQIHGGWSRSAPPRIRRRDRLTPAPIPAQHSRTV